MLHKKSFVFNALSHSTWADSLRLKVIITYNSTNYNATPLKLYFFKKEKDTPGICRSSSMKRAFQRGIIIHCYQRSADGGLLFYSYSDYLVWFSIVCLAARRHRITLLAACPMPDHIHLSLTALSSGELSAFMRDMNREYAVQFRSVCKITGPIFSSPFGSAPKYGAKKGRTNLIYVWNNPVERQLVSRAEDYRWNFLAFAATTHPFSQTLIVRRARKAVKEAVKEIKGLFENGRCLNHAQLRRIFSRLSPQESQQITDFIISTYNIIDYSEAIKYFDSYQDLLIAVHANTGSEHDLNEVFIGKSDKHYQRMAACIMREVQPKDIHDILSWPVDQKHELFLLLRRCTSAPGSQIAKFLRLPMRFGPTDI